ncbi:unnamed protein product [Rotaria sp. Silwood2]|nr:unnamed protein product [Rotaria sp. Silwood2]CAF4327127.1 unnamed protein product [Rotaria sp. Silwood2]
MTINLRHLPYLDLISRKNDHENLLKLTHFKIMTDHHYNNTTTRYINEYYHDNPLRNSSSLYLIVPQYLYPCNKIPAGSVSLICCSSIIHSVVFFEYDNDYGLSIPSIDEDLLFSQLPHLIHVQVTLRALDDCLHLLKQLGLQLCSFSVTIIYGRVYEDNILSQLESISCYNLKYLTMTIYRNIINYEQHILPLFQHLSNVEHLKLLLAIDVKDIGLDHFIDGLDLERDIISYMPNLCQFNFHIRSVRPHAPYLELDTIRQTATIC